MLGNVKAIFRILMTLALVAMSTGCVFHVFNEPMTLTTKSSVVANAERLGPVDVERCSASVLLIIPLSIFDPRDGYDDLLDAARAKGGNAVVDFEFRSTSNFFFIPLFHRQCVEFTGVAAKM
jgi:sugar/nucleoside kinase (ribokinase family)